MKFLDNLKEIRARDVENGTRNLGISFRSLRVQKGKSGYEVTMGVSDAEGLKLIEGERFAALLSIDEKSFIENAKLCLS